LIAVGGDRSAMAPSGDWLSALLILGTLTIAVIATVALVSSGLPEHLWTPFVTDRGEKGADRSNGWRSSDCGYLQVTATEEAVTFVEEMGGLLFVKPNSTRLGMTLLEATCAPPVDALSFRRIDAGFLLLFVDPRVRRLPAEFVIELKGHRAPHLAVYPDGLAYLC
jgi:hypothetical protein